MRVSGTEPGVMTGSEYFFHELSETTLLLHYYIAMCGHYYCESGYRIRGQQVDRIIVMYVEQGELNVEYQGKHEIAPSGSVILLDRNEPHHYYVERYCEFYWMNIGGCNSSALCSYLTQNCGAVFKDGAGGRIGAIMRAILSQFKCNKTPVDSELSFQVHEILCRLMPDAAEPQNENNNAVERAVCFIRANLPNRHLSLAAIAKSVGLSTSYLIRLFQRELNCTPHEYVIQLRMEHAKYLLKTTSMPVKKIAEESGYSSSSSFVSAFTEKVGIPPQQYRELPLG